MVTESKRQNEKQNKTKLKKEQQLTKKGSITKVKNQHIYAREGEREKKGENWDRKIEITRNRR